MQGRNVGRMSSSRRQQWLTGASGSSNPGSLDKNPAL